MTQTNEYPTKAWGATAPDSGILPLDITRRGLREDDVLIEISHCGICHSDLHATRNDWGNARYPLVPGHEIVGTVAAVGENVTRHAIGDRVAVGTLVDSCMQCHRCEADLEQYCVEGTIGTYGGRDRQDGTRTQGGYSERIVVRDEFVLKLPDTLSSAHAAPLLCAGITTYSPLKTWNVGPGSKVAVIGLGGLGHMGVKFAAALGAEVTVITRSEDKRADAKRLGAHAFINSSDKDAMKGKSGYFDLVLNTIPVRHDLAPYLGLLRIDGVQVIVGMIDMVPEFHSFDLIMRKVLTGSGVGGIAQTQEMLDLCGEKNIVPEIETIGVEEINHAFERMEASDVKYRFVIAMDQADGG